MSTRGFLGFVANEHETITYVHFDAYPSGLGSDVLKWARTVTDWDTARQQAAALVHVDGSVMPTDEQREALADYAQPGVGGSKDDPGEEWYRLLHGTFGDPGATLAAGHAPHDPDWPGDSLYCEWGYLIDCDAKTFEVYRGFQESPHKGRFADRETNPRSGYQPVRVIASWPLDALPDDDAFLAIEA
ncbi:hypothetical protein [Streptomyces canus]|uniref:hypothetical protein n=1 Tax=Streptomyces canus TaxID=58343 RepID=UPI003247B6B4